MQTPQLTPATPASLLACNMAYAMLGCDVSVCTREHRVKHGVVTGVFLESGAPKIVVKHRAYNLDQVLTVHPHKLRR